MNRYPLSSKNRNRLGAISTEYVIILVLIAVGGILAFMMLGQQVKEQVATSVDKVGGTVTTDTKVGQVDPTDARTLMTEMGGEGTGDQGGQLQVDP